MFHNHQYQFEAHSLLNNSNNFSALLSPCSAHLPLQAHQHHHHHHHHHDNSNHLSQDHKIDACGATSLVVLSQQQQQQQQQPQPMTHQRHQQKQSTTTNTSNNHINNNNNNNNSGVGTNSPIITTTTTTTNNTNTTGQTVQQRMRRSKKKIKPQKYCVVCGDRAIACNFNATTCESCKAFFRRNAFKRNLKCVFDDQCAVDRITRRFCSSCRLRKCFKVGMLKEWILSDEQKQLKREKIADNKRLRSILSSNNSGTDSKSNDGFYPGRAYSDDGQDYKPNITDKYMSPLSVDGTSTGTTPVDHQQDITHQQSYNGTTTSAKDPDCDGSSSSDDPTGTASSRYHDSDVLSPISNSECSIKTCSSSAILGSQNSPAESSISSHHHPASMDFKPQNIPSHRYIPGTLTHSDFSWAIQYQQYAPCNNKHLSPSQSLFNSPEDIKPNTATILGTNLVSYSHNDCNHLDLLSHGWESHISRAFNINNSHDTPRYMPRRMPSDYDIVHLRPPNSASFYDDTSDLGIDYHPSPKTFSITPEEWYNPEVALNPIVLCTDAAQLAGEWKEWETNLLEQLRESGKLLFKPIGEKFKVQTVREMISQTDYLLGRLVKCMKKLSSFTTLIADDQVQILKSKCLSVLLLRSANVFDAINESWTDADGNPNNKLALEWLKQPRTDDLYQANRQFLLNFKDNLRYDKMIMILLAAILIFDTDSFRIRDRNALAQRKARHIYLLMRYLHKNSSDPLGTRHYLIKIMLSMQNTVDSYLNFMHRETPSKEVYPLLCEFFDM